MKLILFTTLSFLLISCGSNTRVIANKDAHCKESSFPDPVTHYEKYEECNNL